MPYCPKCKLEFISGIETCSECGSSLVDELPEGENVLVPDWEAMDDKERSLNAHREAAQLRNAASTVYVSNSDKYEDLRSTAICFTVLGVLGFIFCGLNLFGILSLYRSPIQLTAMTLIFIIFIAIGISAYYRSSGMKEMIAVEKSLTKEINQWLDENISDYKIEQLSDPSLSEEANYLQLSERIRDLIHEEFAITDNSYLDALIDEFFNRRSHNI